MCKSGLWILLFVAALPAVAQPKKRVAVLNFDYATVQTGVQAIFNQNVDIGRGIADILVDRLVKDGVYSVIERKALDKVLAEQNFSNSDRADPTSAARLGKVLGVDAIIIGSITQFGRDDRKTDVGGGALSRVTGRYGLGGVGTKSSKAVVQITTRMISTDTAEVLASASGLGESTRSGATLLGSGGGSVIGAGGVDMQSTNFGQTILGEAVNKAVTQVAQQLEQQAARVPARELKIDGVIADVTGDTIVLNIGKNAGIKVGDTLTVLRAGREIRDPATGKVLRRMDSTLGQVRITEADDVSAVGTYSGAEKPKVGDRVKN
jgi:curli biogenesis system outer membrane secretion channel CsgG